MASVEALTEAGAGGQAAAAGHYWRPVGLLPLAEAAAEIAEGTALPLAGGPLAFRGLQPIRRAAGGSAHGAPLALKDIAKAVPAVLLARLTGSRAPVAGVDFARPRLLGIVNVTPDSFSDGGKHLDPAAAIAHGRRLIADGADILDIGGESTRPGAAPVAPEEELARVLPVLQGLAGAGRPLSLDTRHSAAMQAGVAAGVALINDVSALTHDPQSLAVAAASGLPVILMHAQGEPATMQAAPRYDDVLLDVYDHLQRRIAACVAAGIPRQRIIVDPGISFGKTLEHNLALLRGLVLLHGLGCAILVGASRKGFIGRLTGAKSPAGRLPGSLAIELHALSQGVQMLRVHDVAAAAQAVAVWRAIHQV